MTGATDRQVVDLFAGPGGWDEGVRPLGIRPHGIELDRTACATARAAGHRRTRGNIAALDPRAFGPIHGLIGSPPCQGFSVSGSRKGWADSVHLLAALTEVRTLADLEAALAELHHSMTDDRSLLALEPLRWTLATTPSWVAWEQVPGVLALWEACATVLRRIGYSVQVAAVNAEQYGVPQTRRRAILVARAPWFAREHGPAALPVPTHSRYHVRSPERLDPGVKPWVSMAEALGWDARTADTRPGGVWRWSHTPCTTIAGDPRITAREHHYHGEQSRTSFRLTAHEATVLQTFPPDYPWQGRHGAVFRQIGDAVPPMLARAIVAEVAAVDDPLR